MPHLIGSHQQRLSIWSVWTRLYVSYISFRCYERIVQAMSYYDVDAILTESQKLPVTFQLSVPGLGYLDGNPGETVQSCRPSSPDLLTDE